MNIESVSISTGDRFGKWVVVGSNPQVYKKEPAWLCRCECGRERNVRSRGLIAGRSKSCGRCSAFLPPVSVSGSVGRLGKNWWNTPEYHTWSHIRHRCYNPNDKRYENYGGRGIKVCQRWLDSYENFLLDMGKRPSPAHTLDRIDNDGDYTVENCRWATLLEQNQNKSTNKLTEESVKSIYLRRAQGLSLDKIAAEFGIDATSVAKIVNGQLWRNIHEAEAYRIYSQSLSNLIESAYKRGLEEGQLAAWRAIQEAKCE